MNLKKITLGGLVKIIEKVISIASIIKALIEAMKNKGGDERKK